MAEKQACTCKKKNCERHGNCDACRAYHAKSKRKLQVACERRKKGLFSLFKSGNQPFRQEFQAKNTFRFENTGKIENITTTAEQMA